MTPNHSQLLEQMARPVSVPTVAVRGTQGVSLEGIPHRAPSHCRRYDEGLLDAPLSAGAVELCLLIAALEQGARAHVTMNALSLRSVCRRQFEATFEDTSHSLPADGRRVHGHGLHEECLDLIGKRRAVPK